MWGRVCSAHVGGGLLIRFLKAKRQVLLTFFQAKRQEKMFIRLLLRLKIIKQCNNDAFLGESATRKVRLLLLVVRLQN